MMKTLKYILAIIFFPAIFFTGCEYDNYDEPGTLLSGQLKCDGEALNTRQKVLFKLYQYREDGYVAAGSKSIDVSVNQEGKFSALLFPGRYKMVIDTLNGGVFHVYDWLNYPKNEQGKVDTLYFNLDGNKTMDFEVRPFYKVNNFQAIYRNDSIIGTFSIEKLTEITEASKVGFRQVTMRLGPTMHINNDTPLTFAKSGATVDTPIEIKASLKDYYTNAHYKNNYRNYAYARIAISLRLKGAEQELLYSPVIKVEGIPQETINKFK